MSLELNEGTKPSKSINVCVTLDARLIQDKTLEEQQQAIKEGLIIRGYIAGELSMGEVAEALGLKYEEALKWLAERGIATWQELPSDMDEAAEKNMRELAQDLNIGLSE